MTTKTPNSTGTNDARMDEALNNEVAVTTTEPRVEPDVVIDVKDVSVFYGDFRAVRHVNMPVRQHEITAMIGPSGCGKSTLLRSLNRMNDLIPSARGEGLGSYLGIDLYGPKVDPVEVRRRIGMVFQKPNPFPKSIYENIIFGPKIAGVPKAEFDELVEVSLKSAALWEEVKDRLHDSALGLSGGQQQRLCIARAIATKPSCSWTSHAPHWIRSPPAASRTSCRT